MNTTYTPSSTPIYIRDFWYAITNVNVQLLHTVAMRFVFTVMTLPCLINCMAQTMQDHGAYDTASNIECRSWELGEGQVL